MAPIPAPRAAWGPIVSVLAVTLAVFWMCSHPVRAADADQLEEITQELRKTGDKYGAAYNAHDVDGLLAFISDESVIVDWRGEAHEGRAAIKAFFTEAFANNPNLKMSNNLVTAQLVSPDAVMTFGELQFTGNGTKWPDASRFAVLWKKVDGQWTTLFDAGFVPVDAEPMGRKAEN